MAVADGVGGLQWDNGFQATPNFIPPGVVNPSAGNAADDIYYINPKSGTAPRFQNWSIGFQRELPWKFVAEAAYIGNRGTRLSANHFSLNLLDAMRKAVNELYEGNLDKRDVFPRGDPQLAKIIRKPLWNNTLHDILKAFGDINVRKVKVQAHVIKRQPVVPLDTARRKLAALVPDLIDWASIQMMRAEDEESKDAPRRSEVASFFSAALELTKDRAVELRQDQPFSDVYVRKARGDTLKAAE